MVGSVRNSAGAASAKEDDCLLTPMLAAKWGLDESSFTAIMGRPEMEGIERELAVAAAVMGTG